MKLPRMKVADMQGLASAKRLLTREVRQVIGVAMMQVMVGCAGDPRLHADTVAQAANLRHEQFEAGPFKLTSYVRITRSDQPLTVYIEGDGRAWRNRSVASDDPTPHQALGLTLAAAEHDAVKRLHQVSLMPASLNAMDVAEQVQRIPQLHFSGSNDKIVPTAVTRSFVDKVGACAGLRLVDGVSHEGGWAAQWPQLLTISLPCSTEFSLDSDMNNSIHLTLKEYSDHAK